MKLKEDFIKISHNNEFIYGGNQKFCKESVINRCGCGVIAAANVISYLNHNYKPTSDKYYDLVSILASKYILTLPYFGVNGWLLSFYVNRYFKQNNFPYRCHWGTSSKNLTTYVNLMLANDIPVILNIGPTTLFNKSKKITLYTKKAGKYIPAKYTSSHFVTITASNHGYFTVSSWGLKYYININDFKNYASKYSNLLFSNILIITK